MLEFINGTNSSSEACKNYDSFIDPLLQNEDYEDNPSIEIFRENDNYEHQSISPEVLIQGSNVVQSLNEFRKSLIKELEPFGDGDRGYEINKTHDEVHEILINLKLYHFGVLSSDPIRVFAKYFYKNLCIKSSEEWFYNLIKSEENAKMMESKSVKSKKGGKKK